MKERERVVVTGVLGVLLISWLGFLVHRSPRFPGSALGSAFGIAGAVLMLVPLAYPIVKRIPGVQARITRRVSLQTLLVVHVYAGILGPAFAMIHTGHKFDSSLGIALTASLLIVVVSGFSVRYLLVYAGQEIKDKLLLLQTARGDLDSAWGLLEKPAVAASSRGAAPSVDVPTLAASVADLEYAVRTHELFKRWFGRALKLHIAVSIVFYVLLALHIGSGIYFGLRWMR